MEVGSGGSAGAGRGGGKSRCCGGIVRGGYDFELEIVARIGVGFAHGDFSLGVMGPGTVGERKAKSNEKAKVDYGQAEQAETEGIGLGWLSARSVLDEVGGGWYPRPGPVAQLVEQETFNLTVRGSSPRGLTEKS